MPTGNQKYDSADDGTDQEGDTEHRSDQPQSAAAFFRWESVADDRAGHREDTARAEALNGAAYQQHAKRG